MTCFKLCTKLEKLLIWLHIADLKSQGKRKTDVLSTQADAGCMRGRRFIYKEFIKYFVHRKHLQKHESKNMENRQGSGGMQTT